MSECSLSQKERLKSRKVIQLLFTGGQSQSAYPIRVLYQFLEKKDSAKSVRIKVAFSVGKRKFPKAVDRSRIKRQMREAYRLQKSVLTTPIPDENYLAVLFLYVGKEALPFDQIKKGMRKNLKKLSSLPSSRTNLLAN